VKFDLIIVIIPLFRSGEKVAIKAMVDYISPNVKLGYRQVVSQQILILSSAGSNPATPAIHKKKANLARLLYVSKKG
jgi:hypothetical protein